MTLRFDIPGLRVRNGCNLREHWSARKRRVTAERLATLAAIRPLVRLAPKATFTPPFVVTLTRVGPRKMDSDNSIAGLKSVRDEIAEELGVNDGDEAKIVFQYGQESGDYGVRVSILMGDQR